MSVHQKKTVNVPRIQFDTTYQILGENYDLRVYYEDAFSGIKITSVLLKMDEDYYEVPFSVEEGNKLIMQIRGEGK